MADKNEKPKKTSADKIAELQNLVTLNNVFIFQRGLYGDYLEWLNEMAFANPPKDPGQ